ncbi:MAG: DUF4347 domain-containing protein, partial [Sedimentisphaerales bacterium]|nr:DUF4347 domain-containing protein [Sedimentisphaerales bacterium]
MKRLSLRKLLKNLKRPGGSSGVSQTETDVLRAYEGRLNCEALGQRVLLTGAWDVLAIDLPLDVTLIDSSLPDYHTLMNALDDGATVQEFNSTYDSLGDILQQTTAQAIIEQKPINSLTILSHGREGEFNLGSDTVSLENIPGQLPHWESLTQAMAPDGNIYIFGCNVAGSDEGRALLNELSRITTADVFASNDLTGAGGNWDLEVASVGAEPELKVGLTSVFDTAKLEMYTGTLAVTIVDDNATAKTEIPADIDVLDNDTDPESDPLTVVDLTVPSDGTVVNNGDGTVTYTPDPAFTGADSFDYIATDGSDGTSHYYALGGDADDSFGSNDGSLNGTTTISGHYGNALRFNETTDYVLIPDFTYNNEFTISFRFKIPDITGNNYQILYSHGALFDPSSINVYIGEATSPIPGIIRTAFQDSNDATDTSCLDVDINALVGDGQWHTYTLTVEAGVGSNVYIDGNPSNSDPRGGDAFNPGTNLYLGAREDLWATQYFGGDLDTLQIFNTPLTAAQVTSWHTTGTATSNTDSATVSVTVSANTVPTAADKEVTTNEDITYTFTAADFNYNDADADPMDHVQIMTLETVGSLELSGVPVTQGQQITKADIDAGNLKFVPVSDANGNDYDTFEFRVSDGYEYSTTASTTVKINSTFDADEEGFTYTDDSFGTANPGKATGTYEAAGGFAGGGLRVYLGPGDIFNPASGGWSDTFNLALDSYVTVSLRYRMIMGEGYEANEYGETILDIDGTRYGDDTNDSLIHVDGDGNGGGDDDTGWQYYETTILLSSGNHTLTVGAYNNDATAADEDVEVFFDNITVTQLTYNTMTIDVNAVNDAPTISNVNGDGVTFTENGGAID